MIVCHKLSLLILSCFFVPIVLWAQDLQEKPNSLIPELSLENNNGHIKLGGALRFNYNFSNWLEDSKKEGGEFGYDVFWLEVSGDYRGLIFNAQYRIYAENSGGGMLKQGWVGYRFNDRHEIQMGQNLVPFGPLPYNSNNWFFNITYYLGFEDNADMGIKYKYTPKNWEIDFAFYKNSDILDFHSDQGITGNHRYAYDVGGRNKEINKTNFRLIRLFGHEKITHELGFSGQAGGLYNLDTKKMGSHSAYGLHYVLNYNRFNFKAQAISYNKSPRQVKGYHDTDEVIQAQPYLQKDSGYVEMGAYGALYNVASKAEVYTAALAYHVPINRGILDAITFYNDFGVQHKRQKGFKDSYQNVTGVMLALGPIFTYVDYALGKNHAWLGEEWTHAFAQGGNHWGGRFNINIGYYF